MIIRCLLFLALLAGYLSPPASVLANQAPAVKSAPSAEVTAFDLILAMNQLRTSLGHPALVEDGILNAVAQSTAEIMAANQMSSHIGNVSGRVSGAGYGGGAKVWATENFAVGSDYAIDEIMVVWADEAHMLPATNGNYCNVGAGVAKSSNGLTYYVLQAAYVSGKSCGDYTSSGGSSGSPPSVANPGVPQIIIPVKIATPDADGKIYHVVEAGQSFWAIAIAYKITIKDIETWNNISQNTKLQIGQKLFIPGKNTEGYATPTPVGMIQVSTPDADGKVVHTVQSYQTLTTIAQAYGTKVETILSLNGIQVEWPLQIGQKLIITPSAVTPSPTPRPLTPIEKLTPASDGKYYHAVKSGESLSWIAGLYGVALTDLMTWNGLNTSSILMPEQKLLLQVTPPATVTPTPGPPTATATATVAPPTPTATLAPTQASLQPTVTTAAASSIVTNPVVWFLSLGLAAGGLFLVAFIYRKKQ